MVHYIYGPSGSGKTYAVMKYLAVDARQGKRAFLIVPEQETVAMERAVISSLDESAQMNIEVLNFSRLCNKIFRAYGGISYNVATKPLKALVMWNTLRELSPMLEEYRVGDVSDFSLTQKMLSATNELKAYCISPEKFEVTTEKIDKSSSSYKKLRDISLIYSAYNSQLCEYFSDASDDISRVLELLKTHDFFADTNVYIDSFAGFTKQEFELISKIGERCDELYITLPLPTPADNSIHLDSLRQTLSRLKKHLLGCAFDETYLTENHRTDSPQLKYLQKNIWNFNAGYYAFAEDEESDIAPYLCDTPYSESDVVASEICRAVRCGVKYGEIAVILRNSEKYRGILDLSLEKYGVPYYFSEKTDLMAKPLAKYIFSALKIKESNWRAQNVMAFLKSGFCNIDPYDIDIFEDYVTTWNINGNKFLGESWTMNPDGYSARFTERAQRILKTANAVKAALVPTLALYFARLDASSNAKEMCRATIDFLKDSHITEKTRESCKAHLDAGDKKSADEDMKLYSMTLNILYDLSNTFGDKPFTFEEFSSALSLMFSESDIGTIPTSADEVMIGSASMMRTGKIKVAIVMGLNEGEFPASAKDSGIFTDRDKELLEELDLTLSASTSIKTSEELFFVYRAVSAPKDRLILTCSALSSDGSTQRQSIVFDRVRSLFKSLPVIKESTLSPLDKVWNIESAKDAYSSIKNSKNARAVAEIIENSEGGGAFLSGLDIPLSQKECRVSPEIASTVFGKRLSLTQSRLEKYVLCGFDYYCTYVLGLRESKRAVLGLNDIGTFIHYILEMFVREISADGKLNLTITNEEIEEILSRTVKKYLCEILGEEYSISNRTKHLFERLNRLSFMIAKSLIEEFKESDFFPEFFELKVGMGDGGIKALEFELADGSMVALRGIADRVDTYRRDGNVYIRVVDYKTGSKEFKFDELKEGLNTQLLIYLFSICYSGDEATRAKFGCEGDGKLIPAGIQYLSSNAPTVSVTQFCESDRIEQMITDEFTRSGLLSSDEEILRAINHDLNPKIVSKVKVNDDGGVSGKELVDEGGFEEIYTMLADTIIEIANGMKGGKADANPLRKGDASPCRYCKMKSICRANQERGGR